MKNKKMYNFISFLLIFFLSINYAFLNPPIEIYNEDGEGNRELVGQANTVTEVDTKIEQLKDTLTAQITEVKEFAKEMEEIAKLNGFKSFVKKIFPIGSIYITYSYQSPPLQGDGVTSEVLPENCAIMTANSHNTGSTSGVNRLDTGSTAGHALTIQQMPAHTHTEEGNHASGHTADPGHGGNPPVNYRRATNTGSTGGNQAHSHSLNIYNQKLLFWRRTA